MSLIIVLNLQSYIINFFSIDFLDGLSSFFLGVIVYVSYGIGGSEERSLSRVSPDLRALDVEVADFAILFEKLHKFLLIHAEGNLVHKEIGLFSEVQWAIHYGGSLGHLALRLLEGEH